MEGYFFLIHSLVIIHAQVKYFSPLFPIFPISHKSKTTARTKAYLIVHKGQVNDGLPVEKKTCQWKKYTCWGSTEAFQVCQPVHLREVILLRMGLVWVNTHCRSHEFINPELWILSGHAFMGPTCHKEQCTYVHLGHKLLLISRNPININLLPNNFKTPSHKIKFTTEDNTSLYLSKEGTLWLFCNLNFWKFEGQGNY